MSTTDIARGIIAALQPLQGSAASGALLVHATGVDTKLAKGSVAVPIVGGQLHWPGAVFVGPNLGAPDGSWTVSAAGTAVAVESLQGGPAANVPLGTAYRWSPGIAGIEATSSSTSALDGGIFGITFDPLFVGLRQCVLYKDLSKADAETFFRAQLFDPPAAALAWESTAPLDGPMAAAPSPRAARTGRGKMLFRHTWILFVVTSRLDGSFERTQEGDELRGKVIERLLDVTSARNGCFRISSDPGLQILDARMFAVTPTSYVDVIKLATSGAIERVDEATYNDWLKTHLKEMTDPKPPDPPINLPDIVIPMT